MWFTFWIRVTPEVNLWAVQGTCCLLKLSKSSRSRPMVRSRTELPRQNKIRMSKKNPCKQKDLTRVFVRGNCFHTPKSSKIQAFCPEMSSQDFTNSKSDSKIGDDWDIFSKINHFMLQMVHSRACCLVTLLSFISFHLLEAASFLRQVPMVIWMKQLWQWFLSIHQYYSYTHYS